MAIVYAITDETVKDVFTEWLRDKSASWLAVSALYLCAISPHYEVWEDRVRDKKHGIVNVSIVVPRGISDEAVEAACEHVAASLSEYQHLIIVTAYEEKPENPIYKPGMPGNRWRLTHNKVNNIRSFEPIPLELDELRYQHMLGLSSVANGENIPDDWFGNTPAGIGLSKFIWENDTDHEWILHPYIFQSDAFVNIEIGLTKRKMESEHYRKYIRGVLLQARRMIAGANSIWINLVFRDTIDSLASLIWNEDISYVEYEDEIIGKRNERPSTWDQNQS